MYKWTSEGTRVGRGLALRAEPGAEEAGGVQREAARSSARPGRPTREGRAGGGRRPAGWARGGGPAPSPGASRTCSLPGKSRPGRSSRQAWAAPTGGAGRGSGRAGSAPPAPPPVSAQQRPSGEGARDPPPAFTPPPPPSAPAATATAQSAAAAAANCPVPAEPGRPHRRSRPSPPRPGARRQPSAREGGRPPEPAAAGATATPEKPLQLGVPESRGLLFQPRLLRWMADGKSDLIQKGQKGQTSLQRDL